MSKTNRERANKRDTSTTPCKPKATVQPQSVEPDDDMSEKLLYPFAIKTFFISNNQFLFTGLQAALSHVTTITMAQGNGHYLDVIHQAKPQLIILDMESHGNVTGLIRELKDTVPHAKILLLAGLNDMEPTREAFIAGVNGVVFKIQPREGSAGYSHSSH